MLDETHNKSHDIHPVKCCVWYSENLLNQSTLWFTAAYPAVSYMYFTCLNHELQTMWAGFCVCPHTINCVYLVSTLDGMHMIKCTRLSPSLVGRAWETRLYKNITSLISPLAGLLPMSRTPGILRRWWEVMRFWVTFDVDVHDVSSLFTNVKQSQPSVAWWGYCVFGTFVLLNAPSWSSRKWSHDLLIIIAVIHSHSPKENK